MNASLAQRVRGNAFWLFVDRGWRLLLNFAVLGVVARQLGIEEFGRLNYAASLAVIFATLATLGLEGLVVRELVRRPEDWRTLLGTAAGLRLGGGCLALFVVGLVAWSHRDGQELAVLAMLVAGGFVPQALEVTDLWFQKDIQSRYTALARGVAAVMGAGVKLKLVQMNAPLPWFAAAIGLDFALAATALAFTYQQRGGRVSEWRFCHVTARVFLRDAAPLIGAGLLVAVYLRVEQVMVRELLGDGAAGVYLAAARLAEQWLMLPGLLVTSVYPLLVGSQSVDQLNHASRMQQLFDALTLLGLLIALGVAGVAPWLVPVVFGEKYRAAVPVLLVLAWTAPVIFNGAARAQFFLLENLTRYHVPSALIGIAVNVAVGLWALPRFGPVGAAASALGGYLCSAFVTSWLFPSLRACARLQTRAFLLPFAPHRVRELIRLIRES
jgi:O-antigen/teichoic acid export membrane protein